MQNFIVFFSCQIYYLLFLFIFRIRLGKGLLFLGGGATCLAFIHPAINAFVLMVLGAPAMMFLLQQLRR